MYVIDWLEISSMLKNLFSDAVFVLLLVIIILDFITGTSKAIINKELNSSIGTRGLIKHSTIVLLSIIMGLITYTIEIPAVLYIFLSFYIFEYILSTLENLDAIGVEFPEGLKKIILTMKHKNENKWGE